MYKTILDWYYELPPPYGGQAARNHIRQHGFPVDPSGRQQSTAAHHAVNEGFDWISTPEGHDYWWSVYQSLQRGQIPTVTP